MMKRVEMTVASVREIGRDTFEMILQNAYIACNAKPGQFLHLLVDSRTLRRPISIASINQENYAVTILFNITGNGTKWLSACQPGVTLDAIGPAGNGFSYDEATMETALLIGGGIGIPPLYGLGKELSKKGIHIKTILGFQSKEYVFYEGMFQEFGKTYVVTNDGSYGNQGFVTSVLDQVGNFDRYFSCGPIPMLKAVTNKLSDHQGSISLEARMGCGVGACFACV